jgi:ABC-type uncharacterized transport system substrate-binding protein
MAIVFMWTPVRSSGVAMVTQRGGEGYSEAKNGFLQTAIGSQLPGLNPKAVELDGTDADAATLQTLKEQAPDLVFAMGPNAAKQVRKVLPEVWIVYGMVFFPEVEGFLQDGKMVGIASLGSAKDLGIVLKALVGKPKNVAVVHAGSVSPSIPDILQRLKSEAGIEGRGISVENTAALKGAIEGLRGQASAVIFLPDSASLDAEAFKAAVGQCVASNIVPVALADGLVAGGALCGAYYAPEEVGAQGARVAKELLEGKTPAAKIVAPLKGATSCNRATANGLKVKFPKEFRPETMYE